MPDPTWKNGSPHRPTLARELERLWALGQQPDPFAFLEAAGPCPDAQAAAVLAVDQWQRWHAGQRLPAEEYLRRCPVLTGDSDAALEVIYGEFLVRRDLGEPVEPAEYLARFPQFAAGLREQFSLFAAMDPSSATLRTASPSRPPTWPAAGEPAAAGDLPELPGYRILGELGRGGMGMVYRAFEPRLGRSLAVKMLLPEHRENASLRRRFLKEAQVMGQLQHPGVAPIHELGELPDGRPFFTMKQVMGQTLAELLSGPSAVGTPPARRPAGGEPAAARLVAVFEQVCQTVAYAHSRGILHRDLKPQNVMVGAFGEVQVMDWGLAKVLSEAGEEPQPPAPAGPVLSPVGPARTGRSADEPTEAGTVLGTPAYMPPEQARGQVEVLDERADVFGLGAILCEVLTGRPPHVARESWEILPQALAGDLADAHRRLEASGAEPELLDLARRCLAVDPAERPPSAGVVAREVSAYRASVAERLRAAEVAAARAAARAEQERKARRLALALAAAVLALGLVAGGGWWWWEREQARQAADQAERANRQARRRAEVERDVAVALKEATTLADRARNLTDSPHQWQSTLAQARHAARLAESLLAREGAAAEVAWRRRVRAVRRRLAADEKDRRLVARLERIRLNMAEVEVKEHRLKYKEAYPRLLAALADHGLPVGVLPVGQAVARLRQRPRPIQRQLLVALEYCRLLVPPKEVARQRWLRAVVAAADGDPWRRRMRAALARGDGPAVRRLVGEAPVARQPPALLLLVIAYFPYFPPEAAALRLRLLQRTQEAHPGDFWANFTLGISLGKGDFPRWKEATRYYTAALALRPDSASVYFNLGIALVHQQDFSGAIRAFRTATRLNPRFAAAYNSLGAALYSRGDLSGAIRACRTAIKLNPQDAEPYYNLGFSLQARGDLPRALRAYRTAIKLNPKHADAYHSLGMILHARGDLPRAIRAYRTAVKLNPKNAATFNNLGAALYSRGNLPGAVEACRTAIKLKPKFVKAYINLGNALAAGRDLPGAIRAYRAAIRLSPKNAEAYNNLGIALKARRDLPGAVRAFRQAIRLDPKYILGHLNLGEVFYQQGKFARALAALKQGDRWMAASDQRRAALSEAIRSCQRRAALEAKLPAVLSGKVQPASAAEGLEYAQVCHAKQLYAAAARLSARSFGIDPKLAGDLKAAHRYNAACWAALAAAGRGKDAAPLEAKERTRWRKQALAWLRADLDLWTGRAAGREPADRTAIRQALRHWQQDADLAGVREQAALAALPEAERQGWHQFWSDVAKLLQKVRPPK
jgi:serine/threonine-protein kinase